MRVRSRALCSLRSTMTTSKRKFYGVRKGRRTGIFDNWPECARSVQGYSGAIYKGFPTQYEAMRFVQDDGVNENDDADVKPGVKVEDVKPVAKVEDDAGDASTCDETEDMAVAGGPFSQQARRLESVHISSQSQTQSVTKLVVFTDGSCLGNGRVGARAGYGAYYGHSDPRNISGRLVGLPQTNQRAELFAVLEVLTRVDPLVHERVEICSDSMYTIKAATDWIVSWHEDPKNPRKQYKNLDLMQAIYRTMKGLRRAGALVTFRYVEAHAGDIGNEAADALAKRGADLDAVTDVDPGLPQSKYIRIA